jgi:homoserine kinase
MSGNTGVKVFAPASIAGFSTGISIMSVAVNHLGDELKARLTTKHNGVKIESISGYKKGMSKEVHLNSASLAGQLLLDYLNEKTGISFILTKNIPLNSGFSSNAASAVAGVFAVNALLGKPLKRYDLLPFAEAAATKFNINPFPAQVCSILFGGIILYKNDKTEKFQKIYAPTGIKLTLIKPDIVFNEQEKLNFIDKSDKLKNSIINGGNIATMISSLYTSDFNLFSESLQDNLLKEQLKHLYPYFQDIEELSISKGAFGCGFAGLGPGIFIASPNSLIADEIELKLNAIFKTHKIGFEHTQTEINLNGVSIY